MRALAIAVLLTAAALTSGCGLMLHADGSKSVTVDAQFAARAIEVFATK